MSTHPPLRAEALQRLAAALSPGGRITRVRDLPGGLDAAMCAFELHSPGGTVRRLVLRRYRQDVASRTPGVAWGTLRTLERLGVAAPRGVWLDQGGELFGVPALVMSRVGGRTNLHPRRLTTWTKELAVALTGLHSAAIDGSECSFLPGPGETAVTLLAEGDWLRERTEAHPDGPEIVDMLRNRLPRLSRRAPVLVHGDYWPGNTVWARGRVTAIVDWDSAAIDDRGLDVGYCRMDLALLESHEASNLFLRAYELASGQAVQDTACWDMLAALRALPDPARWLPGYHGLGRTDVTPDDMRGRLRGFIADALERAGREAT